MCLLMSDNTYLTFLRSCTDCKRKKNQFPAPGVCFCSGAIMGSSTQVEGRLHNILLARLPSPRRRPRCSASHDPSSTRLPAGLSRDRPDCLDTHNTRRPEQSFTQTVSDSSAPAGSQQVPQVFVLVVLKKRERLLFSSHHLKFLK